MIKSNLKSKYTFKILAKNNQIIDDVEISASDLDDAKRKLLIMHHRCEILNYEVESSLINHANFDEILELISKVE
jgi:predicted Zn-ribbon and HTH transcriptional regulator